MSWMTSDGVELLAKLTKYLRETVSVTCCFIAIDTPAHHRKDVLDVLVGFELYCGPSVDELA
jgi:hypothetical protein